MKKLIPLILIVLAAAGGVGAGIALRPADKPACDPAGPVECPEEEAAKADGKKKSEAKVSEFVTFNRQFVVPVMDEDRVTALVVATLALEVVAGTTEAAYAQEPKLRDAFLQVLFIHAHSGGFAGSFTARQTMKDLRERLAEEARPIVGESLRDVLITEIVRQDL
ncbi:flagellar basal body-associated FliL family protein [Oceanibium sediminis]|uniref:flagellar basal body-associated FliL family protein n=1 Tax=Oceanibium sediminis TaxID=2026339 RepID=UPI000DD32812|nr:flagellar basal body-associated FliL family protein [Oceanibium sediminis]